MKTVVHLLQSAKSLSISSATADDDRAHHRQRRRHPESETTTTIAKYDETEEAEEEEEENEEEDDYEDEEGGDWRSARRKGKTGRNRGSCDEEEVEGLARMRWKEDETRSNNIRSLRMKMMIGREKMLLSEK